MPWVRLYIFCVECSPCVCHEPAGTPFLAVGTDRLPALISNSANDQQVVAALMGVEEEKEETRKCAQPLDVRAPT